MRTPPPQIDRIAGTMPGPTFRCCSLGLMEDPPGASPAQRRNSGNYLDLPPRRLDTRPHPIYRKYVKDCTEHMIMPGVFMAS